MVTEIRSFYSLRELSECVEEEIIARKSTSEAYGERLGDILRDNQQTHGEEEWFKALSGPQSAPKDNKSKDKGKGKGKKKGANSDWIQFKDLLLSKENHGEAQILFDAIEDLKNKTVQLEKLRDDIEDLKRLGLGGDIIYIALMREGVPEKIVLHKKVEDESGDKFAFKATICLACETNVIETEQTPDSEQITAPEQPTSPEQPTNPEQITNPEQTIDVEEPTNPEQTTNPEQPINPEQPTPEEPTTPEEPETTETPETPEAPTAPEESEQTETG